MLFCVVYYKEYERKADAERRAHLIRISAQQQADHIEAVKRTEQELRIIDKEKEMNKVWYVIGTKKELKNVKILSGGEIMLDKDANMSYFTAADRNGTCEINTHAKRAKLLSAHPDGSYAFVEDDNGMKILKITDRNTFWSITRYLVIQVR